jgi:hypothetical protein
MFRLGQALGSKPYAPKSTRVTLPNKKREETTTDFSTWYAIRPDPRRTEIKANSFLF